MTHICARTLTIISWDNGLSPSRRQANILTNAGILLIRISGTNFSETLSEIHTFSFKKMYLKMPYAKWRQCSLGLNVLTWFIAIWRPEEPGHQQPWYSSSFPGRSWLNTLVGPAVAWEMAGWLKRGCQYHELKNNHVRCWYQTIPAYFSLYQIIGQYPQRSTLNGLDMALIVPRQPQLKGHLISFHMLSYFCPNI